MDAFFVLSGYLITSLLVLEYRRARGIGLLAFWGRRVRRLLPALLLVVTFGAIYGLVALQPFELGRLRADGLAGLFYVANWRFIVSGQSYFDLFASPSPFRHLWSLAIEEQFYLVWPLVTLGCLRLARGSLKLLAGVCVVGVVASVWLMDALFRADDPSRAYYGTDSRAHTILVGCLLALLFAVWRPRSGRTRVAVQVLGIAAGLFVLYAWTNVSDVERSYYGIGSLVYAVAIAAVIAAAVQPGRGPVRWPLSLAPLRWVGVISYGLYLWHWPVDLWLLRGRVGFGGHELNALRLAATGARVVVLTIASHSPGVLARRTFDSTPAQDASYQRLNRILLEFAARHPNEITIVDLAGPSVPAARPAGGRWTASCHARWTGRTSPRPVPSGHRSGSRPGC